ncbi:MAG: hypothetical protein JRF02_04765 [Deltaproteobacteria bacterium]|nr:hypothetical protein [Deltaproteobacteria bacterium]
MAILRNLEILLVAVFVTYLLSGCGSKPTGAGADQAAPPVSRAGTIQQNREIPPAQPKPTGQTAEPAARVSSERSIFAPKESVLLSESVPVSDTDMKFVQQRLHEYKIKLDQWLQISAAEEESKLAAELSPRGIECVKLLESILTGYGSLYAVMQQNETVPADKRESVDPKGMQQLDIAFLESRCDAILAMDTAARRESTTEEQQYSFAEAQKIINSQVKNENFHEALLGYSRLAIEYPDRQPSITTRLNYGLALQYTGQVEAAARHFNAMLDSGELAVEPVSLQLQLADLLLASGEISAAELHYERLIQAHKSIEAEKKWTMEQLDFLRTVDHSSDDMIAYTKLLREFLNYDYRLHNAELNEKINTFATEYTGSPIAVRALKLKEFKIAQLNFWFGKQLIKIDSLIYEKKFSEAADFLKNITEYNLPANLQAVIQKTYYDIAQAELRENETQKRLQEMELYGQWDTAVYLMDSQRYDMAISAFESLMGTKLEEQAAKKIVEAANLAAGKMRREAATLFIRAGKTPDIEEKKKLLLESHRLLNEILVKFPQSDLLDKVRQNNTILEEQIRKVDPSLLEAAKEANS